MAKKEQTVKAIYAKEQTILGKQVSKLMTSGDTYMANRKKKLGKNYQHYKMRYIMTHSLMRVT